MFDLINHDPSNPGLHGETRIQRRLAGFVAAIAICCAGCAGGASRVATSTPASSGTAVPPVVRASASASVTAAAATSLPAASAAPATAAAATVITVSDADNGGSVALRVGETLRVVLHSTYWTIKGSSDGRVLNAASPAIVSPQTSGCVTGAGCGTVTADFIALAGGPATVDASRTSCGEAMGCTSDSSRWSISVTVR